MINWKVRIKQQWFWITGVSLLFLLIDQVRDLVGEIILLDGGAVLYNGAVMFLVIKIIGVIFALLALIGFPVDLTTEGYGDGVIGLSRSKPAPNASEYGLVEYEDEVAAAEAKSVKFDLDTDALGTLVNFFEEPETKEVGKDDD